MREAFLFLALIGLCGCPDDEASTGSNTETTTEDAMDYGEFCDTYCAQGTADIEAAGCPNQQPYTDADIDSCVETCEAQTSTGCAEESVTFWQCTLDEYPGNFTCDADGNVVQPDLCSAEQQAVLDCFN